MTAEIAGSRDIPEISSLGDKLFQRRNLQDDSGLEYYIYLPAEVAQDAPILVAVHDVAGNAREQAGAFTRMCEQYGAVLVAPVFTADRYPNFQRLGRSRHELDRGKRADEALQSVLAEVAILARTSSDRVHLFGYGAGGRFALRYAMAYPDRVSGVVIASPGGYTFPDPEKRFPQGIAPGQKRSDLHFELDRFLRVPITVLEAVPDSDGAGPPRLEQVGPPSPRATKNDGASWVAAMRAAAADHQLESLVAHWELDGPSQPFEALVEHSSLPERVFEALLGPLPGRAPLFAEEHAHDDTPESSDQRQSQFERVQVGLRRHVLPIILSATLVAILAPIVLWAHYRSTHVVSRDAVVRSHIADVGARLDGVVKSVDVDAGDRVQAGQIVARLEDRHFQAMVRQARSDLEKATRELEVERLAIENERQRLKGSLREGTAEFSAADAELRASVSRADEAQRQLELQQLMFSKGLVAEERVRTAENELRTARALAAAARAERTAAGASADLAKVAADGLTVREKRVSVLEAGIASLRAELAVAEANLEGTLIRSPDDGAVVRRIVQPGGSVGVGQPIISLWVGEEIWVEAWLDEDDLARVAVGNAATVTFKSYPDREFSGRVETLGVSTDSELPDSEVPQPRHERMRDAPVISVLIRLDDPAEDLFPGLSASVGIRKQAD